MMRSKENDYWWLLLFLGLGAWVALRGVTDTRALDPVTGAEIPDRSERIARAAAAAGLTVPQLLDQLQAEADAAGLPLNTILLRRGLL